MQYELIVTAVSDRADLFVQAVESTLVRVDMQPARVLVNEDVRDGVGPGTIKKWLVDAKESGKIRDYMHRAVPAGGMGRAVLWLLQQAKSPIVLHTQEDWLVVRDIPASTILALVEEHGINHVSFNKRKTMRVKHADTPKPWYKIEAQFALGEAQHTMCILDHWRTQLGFWRVARVMPAVEATASGVNAGLFAAHMNKWMNDHYGDGREWNDQKMRHEIFRTYLWGPIGDPAYIQHLGGGARSTWNQGGG